MEEVEQLAEWLHETFRAGFPEQGIPWSQIAERGRDRYRHVARELLSDPPLVLWRVIVSALEQRGGQS